LSPRTRSLPPPHSAQEWQGPHRPGHSPRAPVVLPSPVAQPVRRRVLRRCRASTLLVVLEPLAHAEAALLDARRPLTRAEVDAIAALPLDHLPDLVALAHKVRLAYCGPEVELESLINAKSGA